MQILLLMMRLQTRRELRSRRMRWHRSHLRRNRRRFSMQWQNTILMMHRRIHTRTSTTPPKSIPLRAWGLPLCIHFFFCEGMVAVIVILSLSLSLVVFRRYKSHLLPLLAIALVSTVVAHTACLPYVLISNFGYPLSNIWSVPSNHQIHAHQKTKY